ncbi:hypothetical protein CO669_02515 [Bradyrhizobium sp. Y36]|nr:hypothetical protein CO669_02515 [Bradyrhizobium sp. Y36]
MVQAAATLGVVPDKRAPRRVQIRDPYPRGEVVARSRLLRVPVTTPAGGYGSRIGARLWCACPGRRLLLQRHPGMHHIAMT